MSFHRCVPRLTLESVLGGIVERLLTPTKVSAWLACPHALALEHAVEDGTLPKPEHGLGAFARMLMEKGDEHERACLDAMKASGRRVVAAPARRVDEPFQTWADRCVPLLRADDVDVLSQVPLIHEGVRGVADFLERLDVPGGGHCWEPVDAKLARSAAKPSHVLQLCFYAEALEAETGHAPEHVHVDLGSGERETIRLVEVAPVWRRLRSRLREVIGEPPDLSTAPEPCAHCQLCAFERHCADRWRDEDALHLVAGIRRSERDALSIAGVVSLSGLADREESVAGFGDGGLTALRTQADLQRQARAHGLPKPPHALIPKQGQERWGRGLELLPEPSRGDLVLDLEGHPFWRADRGLFFLFGLLVQDAEGEWTWTGRWAHDVDAEGEAVLWLLDEIQVRRQAEPNLHVWHYNHTERTALHALVEEHGLDPTPLAVLEREGVFVDLLPIVRNAVQIGVPSYGLKHVERAASFQRGDGIDAGSGAVLRYDEVMGEHGGQVPTGLLAEDDERLAAIASYNEDDVRATLRVRNWLIDLRDEGQSWRPSILQPEPDTAEVNAVEERLRATEQPTMALLAELLGYWRREDRAHAAQLRASAERSDEELVADEDAVAGLHTSQVIPGVTATGREAKHPTLRMRFTRQAVRLRRRDKVMWIGHDSRARYADVRDIDVGQGVVDLVCKDGMEHDPPQRIVRNDHVQTFKKQERLRSWAEAVLDAGGLHRLDDAGSRLLLRAPVRLDGVEVDGDLPSALEDQMDLAVRLDRTHLPVQGPPGTGKTYRGARMILALLRSGKRVGITAMSHGAVHNLVTAVHAACEEAGELDLLDAVVAPSGGKAPADAIDGVAYTGSSAAAKQEANLVAGTTWLFSGAPIQENPVDVLFIDEAGQLSLADALAATCAANSVVLLGDPQQLPQVSLATHGAGSGAAVLEHVLAEHRTLPAEEGLFLPETRRMHPVITDFVSEQFYDGRLQSHVSCAAQAVDGGAGLRLVEVVHEGCSTSSEIEADVVVDVVASMVGREWRSAQGVESPLRPSDVMVVTPYNDQKDLLRQRLEASRLSDVRVGTVDRFQGREAPVVIFSAAASDAATASRGVGFVFDRNRFNVAISRARCLAVLVCSGALLDAVPTSVEQMRLLAVPAAFAERAGRIQWAQRDV